MDRLVYIAMSGAKQTMQAQALIAHNIANANTPGFRADLARFGASPIAGPGFPTRVDTVATASGFDHSPGALMETGRALDLAVDGEGWIAVQAMDGTEAYTRGGSLTINALGLLQTPRGELVLGDNGPVAVPAHEELMIGRDGTISIVPLGQGPETLAQVARIKLVAPPRDALVKRPDGLVSLAQGGAADADAFVKVVPGFLESSNASLAQGMIDMIELARRFELEVRMMRLADENAARAADLARLG